MKLDTTLPIYNKRQHIENTIGKNPITILTAETGAGKSTQVPLWLWQKRKKVHITQPRRIAARSLADYLAKITRTRLGDKIGYQTGFDSQQSKATTMLYVTDGVQMVREINRRHSYDILVLDEVHEWNLNQEVLIGLVKKNLIKGLYKKTGKRVVIMSATLQADRLSRYLNNAPVISVAGRGFPVDKHHNDPRFLLPDTAQMVELGCNTLVFQPGKQEIVNFIEDLGHMLEMEKLKAEMLPLHAELSLKEQGKVFQHYSRPKVVVATDIAQTSLTIDDIDAVVDSGIKKELRVVKGIEGLYPVDISEAECMQRAGRAGRVRKGEYFLCADAGIKDRPPFPDPEIQRLNLESVALRLIKMGLHPLEFPFFHAPSKALIFKAIRRLKLLGAITEDEKITEDGQKMADLPVSLRSARLLMEARKGNANVLDAAIKCISILETKGIANKGAAGVKYSNAPYQSDLLNQLALWNSYRQNRKSISPKKFALAQEIYRELNKRLGIAKPPKGGSLTSLEIPVLYRAILSCFADEVHSRAGHEYIRDNESRQLDRDSLLFESKPDMVAGLSFDLVISRENNATGEKEENYLPLITFASELNLDLLDQLAPFSFYKEEKVEIKKGKISVYRELFFGGKLVKGFHSPPKWDNHQERKKVTSMVMEWLETNLERFPLARQKLRAELEYEEIKEVLEKEFKDFDFYWRAFVSRELNTNLRMDDLNMFFKLHPGFNFVHLKKLLPYSVIKELKKASWPRSIELNGEAVKIRYIKGKAFVALDYPFFEKISQQELILPTGEVPGIILGKRRYYDWEKAVLEYNRWKRNELFERKYKDQLKPAHMDDLLEVPFPQAFEAGRGKDNSIIEFYIVPNVEEKEARLDHFFEKEEAEAAYEKIRGQWQEHIRRHKKGKLEDIFKQKGWKVKT